jgi:hypothetical protein
MLDDGSIPFIERVTGLCSWYLRHKITAIGTQVVRRVIKARTASKDQGSMMKARRLFD